MPRTPPAPIRRALAATILLAAALGAGAGLSGGTAGAATTPPGQAPLALVTLTAIDPVAGVPGRPLTVRGTVAVLGSRPLASVRLQLRIGADPVSSRTELAQLATATDRPPGDVADTATLPAPGTLQPGADAAFELTVAAPDLGRTGVYPMAVEVIADDPGTGARTRVGASRTFLPWDMSGVRPTRLAVLWPVLAAPSRDATGAPIGTLLADQVAARLDPVVAAGEGSRLTWLLDGDLLESASASPDPAVGAWLHRLGDAAAAGQVLALPYADPDLVATVRAGLASDVVTALGLGPADVTAVLGPALAAPGSVGPVSWPADGTADTATLTTLAGARSGPVVLSDAFTATVRDVTAFTPSGVGPLARTGLTAAVSDSVLSALLATSPQSQGGAVTARQRMLSELAVVGAELPSQPRALVMVPPRRWTPDADYVRGLLQAMGSVPWVQLTTLGDLTATAATGPARQVPTYPAAIRARELDAQQLALVKDGHRRLDALTAVLSRTQPYVDTYTRALLRSESTAWRTDRAAGHAYAGAVVRHLDTLTRSVHIVGSGPVTLAARSGKIPVTIVNDLDQEVTVRLGAQPFPPVRLSVTPPEPVTLQPHSQTTVDLSAQATANGSAQLVVRLLTLDGQDFGPASSFPVEITGYGAVAKWLVGGALALLAVALAVRVVRAVRRGRRPGSAASVRERAR